VGGERMNKKILFLFTIVL